MKVLVTGGAGFIGSHIVDALLDSHYEVVVVDNLVTGHIKNIHPSVRFYQLDVRRDLDDLFGKEKPDYVIHQAGQVSVSQSLIDPLYDCEENIIGTLSILQACVRHHVKKMVFASTAAIYGNPVYLPVDEGHPLHPISFYGLTKWHAEKCIQLFSEAHQLDYTILRYANVYGPRQDARGEAGAIAIFIEKVIKGERPVLFGDGKQTRDFVYVKDVARANVAALTNGNQEILNVGTGQESSLEEVIGQLGEISGKNIQPILSPERAGDIRSSVLNNERLQLKLNRFPFYSLKDGLVETVKFYEQEFLTGLRG
ncbi:NAD-dependent epimerase/dehydratase family protein [Rossellomorea vietnamensis]|uniref:NAD-dependent epimerase/dehydratase family protein n=1 Tax=Rossellomorea vietnamensis TaxID=218284 RepID=UPI001CC90322|nr:NAD-dependent epimerase/dehydratase family protein [Rossellomorea vietnamensis]MCA0149775.1 NAD-dependent epimerase/dehydratase family protein [Rossellomorea vietnamensis]